MPLDNALWKQIPYSQRGWTNCFTYMNWELITNTSSPQYKLIQEAGGRKYNGNGYGQIEGHYVIACAANVGTVGDYIDVKLANGLVLHCIVGDIKSPGDANYDPWGHLYGGGYISVIEFVTNWGSSHANPGTNSEMPQWKGNLQGVMWVGNWWGNKPGEIPGGSSPSPERPPWIENLFDSLKTIAFIDSLAIIKGVKIIQNRKSPVQYFGSVNGDGLIYFNDSDFYRCGRKQPLQIYNTASKSWVYSNKIFNLKISLISSSSLVTSTSNGSNFSPPTIVTPDNGGFVPGGSADPVGRGVEAAIQWALSIAADDSHGYSQENRWGPDYDCSSLLYSAFQLGGGFDLPTSGTRYTGSMVEHFSACGFTWRTDLGSDSSLLNRGDILLNEGSHTALYLGNGQCVAARSAKYPKHQQISTHSFYNYPWDGVLRYAS